MRKLFWPAVACTIWLMFTGSAAADITYPVNFTLSDGSSVSGDIVTDGLDPVPGPVSTIGVVSFDLVLTNPNPTPVTAELIGGAGVAGANASVFLGGGGLVANTNDTLTFNVNQGAFANFFSTDTGCQPLLSIRGPGGTLCNGTAGPSVQIAATSGAPGTVTGTPGTDLLTLGGQFPLEEVPPTPTPEPASLGMLVVGLVSMISLRKRRS